MTSLIPTVTLVDGTPRVSSLDIAEKFGKRHTHVLRAIQSTVADLSANFTQPNFGLSEYADETGRKLPMYHLTRDAFALVAMGFTGKAALEWKVKYIEAFNAMETELLKSAKRTPLPSGSLALETPEEHSRRMARERKQRQRERARLALPAGDPVQEEIETLLKKVEFYTKEVDHAGEEIAKIMARESLKKDPALSRTFGDLHHDFHIHTATSVRLLFSSINFSLNAVRDTVKIRREHGI